MAHSLPLILPPTEVVRELANYLDPGVPRSILDAACGEARNSVLLANMGHHVLGLDNDEAQLAAARGAAEAAGVAEQCRFVNFDVRDLASLPGMFDIVLSNEVLYTFPPSTSKSMLAALRHKTRQGGLNVVSDYLVRPGEANIKNTAQCFKPGQLQAEYADEGWLEIYYNEIFRPNQYTGSGAVHREHIFSKAMIIAQRPWGSLRGVPAQRDPS